MPDLYLTPASISYLNQCILALVITGYFARMNFRHRGNPAQTAYLLAAFASVTTFSILLFLDAALLPSQRLFAVYLENTALAVALAALIQFAYNFPAPDPRLKAESRIVLVISAGYAAFEAAIAVWRFHLLLASGQVVFRADYLDYLPALEILLLGFIFARGTIRNWSLPASRRFALILVIPFLVAIVNLLRTFYYVPTWVYHVSVSVGIPLTMFLLALNYLASLPEITSFTVKISGLLLTSILAILSVIAWIITPAYAAQYAANLEDHRTLRFTPDGFGGYEVTQAAFHFEEDLGEKLDLIDAGEYRPIREVAFKFPLFEKNYTSVCVMDDGMISLGECEDYKDLQYHFGSSAAIFPLLLDLAPDPASEGAVYLDQRADRLVVTYHQVRAFHQPQNVFTFQITLFASGEFEITYNGLPKTMNYFADDTPTAAVWAIGFKPEATVPQPAEFLNLPLTSAPSGLLQDEYLSFRRFLHELLFPLALAILASSLIFLAGIPILLQSALSRPLNALLAGVQSMNSGKRGTVVRVQANDEIGFLTQSFNRMSAELDGLITGLESRVAARTSELRESEKHYRQLFELESDALFIIRNSDGQILEANDAASELYGYTREELLARRNTDISAEPEVTQKATKSPVPTDQVVKIHLRWHRKKDGTKFPVGITARFVAWKGESVHIAAIRDITEQHRFEQELAQLAITDALTSLPNRRHFLSQAEQVFDRSNQPPFGLALFMLDLDHFKKINDHYGHAVGDAALREAARILSENLRPTDLLSRVGGEEFAVLLPRTLEIEACQIAQRLCQTLADTSIRIGDGDIRLTVSIGAAVLDETVSSLDELLNRADQALYLAKERGRNRFEIWETS
jgi:diguanylate cyclase (GGDEF)-like protein/PAS domain S-box-containing protein